MAASPDSATFLASSPHRNELLHALPGIDLPGVEVALRIHGGDVEKMKLPAAMAVMADLVDDLAGFALELPHHVVHDVGDEDVFLARVRREIDRARRAAAQRLVGDDELLEEPALLGEDLDAVAAAIADVKETVVGNAHAVHR